MTDARRFLSLATGCLCLGLAAAAPAQQRAALVQVAPVLRQQLTPSFEVLGEARAVRSALVGAEVAGLVAKLEIQEGDALEAGAVLLALETTLKGISLRAAEARLATAREQLEEYRRGSRKEDVAAARADVARAQALVVEAEDELQRIEELLKDNVASERDRTRARAAADSSRAGLAAAKAKLERAEAGPRREVIARAEARVEEVQAEADLLSAEIEKAQVRAPFAGVVAEKLVERGAYVSVGSPLCRFVQLDPIELTVAVPERLFAKMPRDLPLEIRFDAFPDRKFEGRIHRIVPVADRLARTIPVRLRLPNPERKLLPGMVARAMVPTPTKGEVLTVPADAVVRTPRGRLVYRIRDGKAEPVPVQLGARQDGTVEVQGPLQAGEVVATRGNERLYPGAAVQVAPAAAPAEGRAPASGDSGGGK